MFIQENMRKLSMSLAVLFLFASPSLSYADWAVGVNVRGVNHHDDYGGGHFYRYHEHPHYGLHMHFLPEGCITIWVGGARYFYYDGLYYIREGGEYVLVNPPVGAYVSAIPGDFQPVMINGVTYYTDNGVYYVLTRHHGYKVVEPPVVYVQQPPVVVSQPQVTVVTTPVVQQVPVEPAAPVTVDLQDSFTVNVPSDKGGYAAVVIKKSGNGFVGPQGEFYSEFPKVSQLKVMYGK
ncbi:MAG: hypothetical protein HQL14_08075 [Candidatus Omnitrophica bacterium]|nr:hypothetical protein [Candidatus Omnitrophota bacterium]